MATKSVTAAKDTVEAGLEELKAATAKLSRDIHGHEQAIRDATAGIAQAKAARDAALDGGDTTGFEKAMSDLRKANAELTQLQRAGNWQSRLAELDALHKSIVAAAREERATTKVTMDEARIAFEKAHEQTRRVVDALGAVNEIRQLIQSQTISA